MELEKQEKHTGMENIELKNVTNLAEILTIPEWRFQETNPAGIPKRIFVYIVIAVAVRWWRCISIHH